MVIRVQRAGTGLRRGDVKVTGLGGGGGRAMTKARDLASRVPCECIREGLRDA
jgi:hypothetical protein